MAARRMTAAKERRVYWQKTGDAECLESLPIDWKGPQYGGQQVEMRGRTLLRNTKEF
ncbi:hypothetical protein QFZ84_001579 [Pseudomonas fluorescens]